MWSAEFRVAVILRLSKNKISFISDLDETLRSPINLLTKSNTAILSTSQRKATKWLMSGTMTKTKLMIYWGPQDTDDKVF